MFSPKHLSPERIYQKLLEHPSLRDESYPTLDVFRSWSPQKQADNLDAFRDVNPGIFAEAIVGRKIKGIKEVSNGIDAWRRPKTRTIIHWGKLLE